MKIYRLAGLLALVLLAGCGTRLNPGNWGWFGGGRDRTPTLEPKKGYEDTTDYRPMVARVVSVQVEPVAGGVIVTAVGLPPTQGYFATDLVPTFTSEIGKPAPKDGVMALEFRIVPPPRPWPAGSQASREVTAALYLTDQSLGNTRQITVAGSQNKVSARR
ncbi:hypothetical protein [Tropicimonas sp. IMCC34043]|uniref:hypothetical protein n=1 Tax=Tropicimonas sp. IMCC34043 TaxID=2248760 RepID=UPI000E2875F4|nr:hypothetical protein [Tropicimonas sp. IMCC34043]